MTGYYVEDLESLPIELLASGLARELPPSFARLYTRWRRLRARLGWRENAVGAVQWVPTVNWRDDQPPAGSLTLWGPWLEQLDDHGFQRIGWIDSPTIGEKQEANLWLRNSDGTVFAQLNWTVIGTIEDGNICLQSYLQEGRELQTISIRNQWQLAVLENIKPEYVDLAGVKTHSLAELMQSHSGRLKLVQAKSLSEREFKNQLPEQVDRFFQHAVKLGFLRELSQREVRRLRNKKR